MKFIKIQGKYNFHRIHNAFVEPMKQYKAN